MIFVDEMRRSSEEPAALLGVHLEACGFMQCPFVLFSERLRIYPFSSDAENSRPN
jgi:hypothetical protein